MREESEGDRKSEGGGRQAGGLSTHQYHTLSEHQPCAIHYNIHSQQAYTGELRYGDTAELHDNILQQ